MKSPNARLALLAVLVALWAAPARADVDIPTAAPCREAVTNSVTNKLYANCGGDLVEIDGATHAQRFLPITGLVFGVDRIHVDPIHNRVVTSGPTSVTIFDVPAGSTTVVPLFLQSLLVSWSRLVALDPVSDSIWAVEASAGRATRIDGATGATTSVDLGATGSLGAIAIDPVGRFAYATVGGPRIVEIDLASLATRDIVLAPPVTEAGIAVVDPVRRKLYAVGASSDLPDPRYFTTFRIDPMTGEVEDVDAFRTEQLIELSTDPGNEWVWRYLFWQVRDGTIELLTPDGTSVRSAYVHAWLGGSTANPGTGRVYVAYGGGFPNGNAGLAGFDASPLGDPYDIPFPTHSPSFTLYLAGSPAVMLSTNKVYVPYENSSDPGVGFMGIREVDEAESAPIPLPTMITHDPVAPDGSVVVHFEATSGFPTPLPIEQIYYQVDSIDGAWAAASQPGQSSSATLQLAPGPHTIHAFAVDGQEATVSVLHRRNPIVGPVASLDVAFTPACSNEADDDGDSLADYPADPGCISAMGRIEDPQCDNGLDDDGDLAIDYPADSLCRGRWDNNERTNPSSSGCGLGAELALALAAVARRRFGAA